MKNLKKLLVVILALSLLFSFTACGKKSAIKIAVPNDPTNEARALALLQAQGVIKLEDTGDTLATVANIKEKPEGVEFEESEAAQIPAILKDVSYAVINSNYAIEAGLTPFVTEDTDISFPNVICVKQGSETSDKTKALVAAVSSKAVADYINDTYKGAIVCDLKDLTDGYDASVDYAALSGSTISIGASPTPHADILKVAKDILAAKGITLDIKEFSDYVLPNTSLEDGSIDANYFAHIPYQENFNAENNTHIAWVLEVHHEPMGVYSDKFSDWSGLKVE